MKKKRVWKSVLVVVLLTAIAVVVAEIVLSSSGKSVVQEVTTTTLPPGTPSRLTGELVSDEQIITRPVIMLKIDNSPLGRPQYNLDKADIVYEERVEGGLTRFIAMYQLHDSDRVGPVRSVRSSDPDIVDPMLGLFGYSGGIPAFINALHNSSAVDVGIDRLTDAYTRHRDAQHKGEHTLYADLGFIRNSELALRGGTPPQWFEFLGKGELFASAGARPSTGATVHMGTSISDFTWDPARKLWMRGTDNAPHMVATDNGQMVQLGYNNVIIQNVSYANTSYTDVARNPVDRVVSIGSGTGFALIDGKYVDINWSKANSDSVTTYTDKAGAPLKLTPGKTWVVLAPNGSPVTVR